MHEKFLLFQMQQDFDGPSYEAVQAFIVAHAIRNESCKTLSQVASKLRTHHTALEIPFLSPREESKLRAFIADYKLGEIEEIHRMIPFTLELIEMLTADLDMRDLKQRCLALCILLGHDALLRGAEIVWRHKRGQEGPQVRNFSFSNDNSNVMYTIPRTKTHRQGPAEKITFAATSSGPNAVQLLKLHLELSGLWGKPTDQLFPDFVTTTWLRRQLKQLALKYGIDPSVVGTHVCRAGGATDLFNSNIPTWAIMKFGRWKSNAVLLYQRDEHNVMRMVKRGFEAARRKRLSLSRI